MKYALRKIRKHVDVRWGERLGREECPYLRRWALLLGVCSLRVHHFLSSDDDRHFHDHPWWFVTLVLRGGYTDVSPCPVCEGLGFDKEQRNKLLTQFDKSGVLVNETITWCQTCDGTGDKEDHLGPGSIRYRPALHRHTVRTDPGGVWTLIITGPALRQWGFWVNGRFRKANRYFFDHGHHPCDDQRR